MNIYLSIVWVVLWKEIVYRYGGYHRVRALMARGQNVNLRIVSSGMVERGGNFVRKTKHCVSLSQKYRTYMMQMQVE